MIDAVFFDLVGTLIRPRHAVGHQYSAVARRHGAEVDALALEKAFHHAMRVTPGLEGEASANPAAERRWWAGLVRNVVTACGARALARPGVFDDYFADLYEHFTTANAWALYDDTLPALDALAARGISTGLITNYDTRVYRVLDALGLASRLDPVSIPADTGVSKPDCRMFANALHRAGVAASHALHVGDSLGDDYHGALAAGMNALLLDRQGRYAARPDIRRIGRLGELIRAVPDG